MKNTIEKKGASYLALSKAVKFLYLLKKKGYHGAYNILSDDGRITDLELINLKMGLRFKNDGRMSIYTIKKTTVITGTDVISKLHRYVRDIIFKAYKNDWTHSELMCELECLVLNGCPTPKLPKRMTIDILKNKLMVENIKKNGKQ